MDDSVTPPSWEGIRRLTPARVALGRAGAGLPTEAHLRFQLAHAQARDAVQSTLDVPTLMVALRGLGLETIALHSAARDRGEYLKRPDRGRRLDDSSREALHSLTGAYDVVFVIADGLSAAAVDKHATPLLENVLPPLRSEGWHIGPACVVEQGRVAIGDDASATLNADMAVVLIGERPGLSSPESLGVYLTWEPRPGRTDAERNCLSNVRPEGLGYQEAAHKLLYLMREARRRRLSGVELKEEAGALPPGEAALTLGAE